MTAWAYIAHKDGKWAGIASAKQPKRALRKFLGDFAADGFSITTVEDREEYNRVIGGLAPWRQPLAETQPELPLL